MFHLKPLLVAFHGCYQHEHRKTFLLTLSYFASSSANLLANSSTFIVDLSSKSALPFGNMNNSSALVVISFAKPHESVTPEPPNP